MKACGPALKIDDRTRWAAFHTDCFVGLSDG
jgi:hypothetical protein